MNKNEFSKNIEKLVNPITVGSLHFLQSFVDILPKKIQGKLIRSSSKNTPYMGFVVEPYSYFLCYEITDIEKAKSLLPDGFELIKTKIFEDDEPKYYCIFGCITAHTSGFWGSRIEFYIIAENKNTSLLSWIIVDYDTNTISYDKKRGLMSPNASSSVITTTYDGNILVDFVRNDTTKKLIFESDIKKGVVKHLDQRLWLEGNLSIGYGKYLSENDADIFSLKFDPLEVKQALEIPLSSLKLEINTWYPGLFNKSPSKIACFQYAQHFLSDSPGSSSLIKNEKELISECDKVKFEDLKVFSTKSYKIMFFISSAISLGINITLLLLWLNSI